MLTITDLFCGAGGSGLGAAAAGYRLVMAANHWQQALLTAPPRQIGGAVNGVHRTVDQLRRQLVEGKVRLPNFGSVVESTSIVPPFVVIGADNAEVEPISAFLRDLTLSDCSQLTVRSYAHDLLRWWRLLGAVNTSGTRQPAARWSCWSAGCARRTTINGAAALGRRHQDRRPSMTTASKVQLDAGDAAEIAEALVLIADWLRHDPDRLKESLRDFVDITSYDIDELHADLARLAFLLGGDDRRAETLRSSRSPAADDQLSRPDTGPNLAYSRNHT